MFRLYLMSRLWGLLAQIAAASTPVVAGACPMCCFGPKLTLREEIDQADIVVIARLIGLNSRAKPAKGVAEEETPNARFHIVDIIKGSTLLETSPVAATMGIFETFYFGEGKPGCLFWITAAASPEIRWSPPTLLTDRGRNYMHQIVRLPIEQSDRLEFYLGRLEDEDELLAEDAADELGKAAFAELVALRSKLNRGKLVTWIKNGDLPARRRRLYLTMLSVCGSDGDLPMLERLLRSQDKEFSTVRSAVISCYLALCGERGMPLIEALFLKDKSTEFIDVYAALMALTFHGTEIDVIPRERILVGLRYILDRPEIADLVVPFLARWQDWSVMHRLVELFKSAADEQSKWIRVPVITYLDACPLPAAEKHLAELKKIDPAAFERAKIFLPADAPGGSDDPNKAP